MKYSSMTSRILTPTAAVGVLAALALSSQPAAQGQPYARYTVTDIGTLPGGSFSIAFGAPSPGGQVGGFSSLADGSQRAVLWQDGRMTDLGTLGGKNSGASGPNRSGEAPIIAETATTDPLGENFCGFLTAAGKPSGKICRGAYWKGGLLRALPTLGGNNAEAFALNNAGWLAGAAETRAHDPTCLRPQRLAFEAALWAPSTGAVHALAPLPGDTVGFALDLNDRGEVVGASGSCANTTLVPLEVAPHAVLWANGSPKDLGSLGGRLLSTAAGVNEQGDVIGGSDLAGDTAPCSPGCHSFLWTKRAGMQDLGTLPGDVSSLGGWINDKGQVVGWSCAANPITAPPSRCRAYLWQHNVMTDLNALIPAPSSLRLLQAFGINDAGQIVGLAQRGAGALHAFLATPASPAAGQ
jgi:probable HAF family extracellular repeat protein